VLAGAKIPIKIRRRRRRRRRKLQVKSTYLSTPNTPVNKIFEIY